MMVKDYHRPGRPRETPQHFRVGHHSLLVQLRPKEFNLGYIQNLVLQILQIIALPQAH